jgi:signal transduction histidine kinase
MIAASIPANEPERLEALERYSILDTPPAAVFDELAQLAASICATPVALVSLVDATRQWFKARVGLELAETSRELSFCAHAIAQGGLFVVHDALADPRFAANPLVTGDPKIRFYAGAPLTTPDGFHLGTLCVIDRRPRELDAGQRNALRVLAHQVVTQLELRRQVMLAEEALRRTISISQEVERMKRDFVSMVSHELRTPLTSIRGSLGLLAAGVLGDLDGEARHMVTVAERNSVRLIALINDILDFEKLESGKVELSPRPISVFRIVERSVETVSAFAEQEGVRVRVQCDDATVTADESRLTQVMVNLLSNAIKYSDRGSVVTIRTRDAEEGVEIRIEDHGRGIAPAAQPKLFERFHQIDSSDARSKPGTGLGLAICKAIIDQHGGAIGVESREGEGSTFWFRLPSGRLAAAGKANSA